MPHLRPRHLASTLSRALKYWPVLCLVGSRQVGKSTFLRGLPRYRYHSFDDIALAALAERNPSQFLDPPCVIDEAQKAPSIFDAVKLDVDREKRPGKFILTGSVRFSRRTLIRESLTGRAKTLQMYPLTCAETLELAYENRWQSVPRSSRVVRKDFQRYLARGGMPGIFAARSQADTASYWNTLIESYVYRDLLLAVPKNPRPRLALAILKAVAEILALGELPTFSRIFRKTGGTRALVERHIQGLEDMMVLHRIGHWKSSRTKDILMPFDSAFFLTLLGLDSPLHDAAIHAACLHIALINEALSQAQSADRSLEARYAISPKGELIHLITPGPKNHPMFWKVVEDAVPHDYQLRFLVAQAEKNAGQAIILSSTEKPFQQTKTTVLPWESVL